MTTYEIKHLFIIYPNYFNHNNLINDKISLVGPRQTKITMPCILCLSEDVHHELTSPVEVII